MTNWVRDYTDGSTLVQRGVKSLYCVESGLAKRLPLAPQARATAARVSHTLAREFTPLEDTRIVAAGRPTEITDSAFGADLEFPPSIESAVTY